MITYTIMVENRCGKGTPGRLKSWGALLIGLFLLWAFVFYGIPLSEKYVPGMARLTQVVKERDIDTTTFFYSETKESYEAEQYLNDTLGLQKPRGYDGFSFFFLMGIASCIAILAIGFWLMSRGPTGSMDVNNEDDEQKN